MIPHDRRDLDTGGRDATKRETGLFLSTLNGQANSLVCFRFDVVAAEMCLHLPGPAARDLRLEVGTGGDWCREGEINMIHRW